MTVKKISPSERVARTEAAVHKVKTLTPGEAALKTYKKDLEEGNLKAAEQVNTEGSIAVSKSDLNKAQKAAEKVPVVGTAVKAGVAATEAANTIAGAIGSLTEVSTWLRIGKVLGGAIVVLFGLYLFAKAVGAPSIGNVAKVARG